MPENFCLTENHDAVAGFLAELRHSLTISGQKIRRQHSDGRRRHVSLRRRRRRGVESYVDFASMQRITPGTALVLASEYDRARTVFRAPKWLQAINIESWNPAVLSVLDEVGFLSLLEVDPPRRTVSSREGVYILPFFSGTKVIGAEIDRLILAMASLATAEGVADSDTLLSRSRVYDGLGEAIQNVEDHAYPVSYRPESPVLKQWWMTGAVEPVKKRFNIVTYDQGISIPANLPRWNLYDDFRTSFLRLVGSEFDAAKSENDGEAISQAVQLGRSSTGKPWHGKGLPRMREIVENCQGGSLRILSRCGEYVYSRDGTSKFRSFAVPLQGTLVEWDLYL